MAARRLLRRNLPRVLKRGRTFGLYQEDMPSSRLSRRYLSIGFPWDTCSWLWMRNAPARFVGRCLCISALSMCCTSGEGLRNCSMPRSAEGLRLGSGMVISWPGDHCVGRCRLPVRRNGLAVDLLANRDSGSGKYRDLDIALGSVGAVDDEEIGGGNKGKDQATIRRGGIGRKYVGRKDVEELSSFLPIEDVFIRSGESGG
jgi:hypothetical protein